MSANPHSMLLSNYVLSWPRISSLMDGRVKKLIRIEGTGRKLRGFGKMISGMMVVSITMFLRNVKTAHAEYVTQSPYFGNSNFLASMFLFSVRVV